MGGPGSGRGQPGVNAGAVLTDMFPPPSSVLGRRAGLVHLLSYLAFSIQRELCSCAFSSHSFFSLFPASKICMTSLNQQQNVLMTQMCFFMVYINDMKVLKAPRIKSKNGLKLRQEHKDTNE